MLYIPPLSLCTQLEVHDAVELLIANRFAEV